jgi:hypothetical protein
VLGHNRVNRATDGEQKEKIGKAAAHVTWILVMGKDFYC